MTQTEQVNENRAQALRLLGTYTAGRFDFWMLAGNAKASCRAHVMSAFNGKRTPRSAAGVNAMRDAFFTMAYNDDAFKASECLAAREQAFEAWAAKQVI